MLLTKNYKRAFKFGKVIIWNTVSYFTSDTVKAAITSAYMVSSWYKKNF